MADHQVVSSDEWLAARLELLKKEKEFSHQREILTRLRLELPWVKVEKSYTFDGTDGRETLADLFGESRQLIVYHFMFGPDWDAGCKMCSLIAEHYDPLVLHLRARDVSLITVSRAPLEKLLDYKRRMGWSFKWVSSLGSDFNWDYHVSFAQDDLDAAKVCYNYQDNITFPAAEAPGISVFFKDEQGDVFHTYSSYARGLENFLGIYNFLDIVPQGRDENGLPYGMEWVRRKDEYDAAANVDVDT